MANMQHQVNQAYLLFYLFLQSKCSLHLFTTMQHSSRYWGNCEGKDNRLDFAMFNGYRLNLLSVCYWSLQSTPALNSFVHILTKMQRKVVNPTKFFLLIPRSLYPRLILLPLRTIIMKFILEEIDKYVNATRSENQSIKILKLLQYYNMRIIASWRQLIMILKVWRMPLIPRLG